jgi:hypothetical protein
MNAAMDNNESAESAVSANPSPMWTIYSTTVIGQDRRIAYNERDLRSSFPMAEVVYLDLLEPDERVRVRGFLVGGSHGNGSGNGNGNGSGNGDGDGDGNGNGDGNGGACACPCARACAYAAGDNERKHNNIRFPQLFSGMRFVHYGDCLYGR